MSEQPMPHPSIIQRLDRFEEKLDRVADALTVLARIEERQQAGSDRMNRFEYRLDTYEVELQRGIRDIDKNSQAMRLGERVGWTVMSAILSGVSVWASKNFL